MYNIKRTDPNSIYYAVHSPFGTDQNPLFWTDGLVINKNACDDRCMEATDQFVNYYNSVQAKNLIAFSEDSYTTSPPRYVLPATVDFYQEYGTKNNPYFPVFNRIIDSGRPFPSSGIVYNITERYEEICGLVRDSIPDTECICDNTVAEKTDTPDSSPDT